MRQPMSHPRLRRYCSLLFAFAVMLSSASFAAMQSKTIDSGWRFRALAGKVDAKFQDWHAATVPGVVQTDLLTNKLIPDPFYGRNEFDLQWIGLAGWEYQTQFDVDAATLAREHVELAFDGLDTFATVYVNEEKVLDANNMFRVWRVDCKKQL